MRHLRKVVVGRYFTPILTFPHQGGRDFWTAHFSIEGEGTFEIVLVRKLKHVLAKVGIVACKPVSDFRFLASLDPI